MKLLPKKLGDKFKEEEQEIDISERKVIVKVTTYDSGKQRVHSFFSDRNISWLVKRNIELKKQILKLREEKNDILPYPKE